MYIPSKKKGAKKKTLKAGYEKSLVSAVVLLLNAIVNTLYTTMTTCFV